MSLSEIGIEYKKIPETLAATMRVNLKNRADLPALVSDFVRQIPRANVAGAPFGIFQFVTSITDGMDAEIGFPVNRHFETGAIKTRVLPPLQVFSLIHRGPAEELRATFRKLYGATAELGLISDEFAREVYLDWEQPSWNMIEAQFVLHDWNQLFGAHLSRVYSARKAKPKFCAMSNLSHANPISTRDSRGQKR